jgi:hypothetical protein
MDNTLSWKNHVEHIANKANQRLRLIKLLARAAWGSTQETMNTTYKTYIKPVMKYGSEVLIMASGSTLKALETTQNNALRLITGGVKTTPILALQQYTGHLPITWEIKQQAAVSTTKMKALTQTTWTTRTSNQQHLKTQLTHQHSLQSSQTTRNTYQGRTHMPINRPRGIPIISYQPLPSNRSEEKRYPHHSATTIGTSDHQRKITPRRIPEDIY